MKLFITQIHFIALGFQVNIRLSVYFILLIIALYTQTQQFIVLKVKYKKKQQMVKTTKKRTRQNKTMLTE